MTEKMYTVGKIINTHGIHGEVKVLRITDFEERFSIGKTLYIVKDGNIQKELTIESHRMHKGFDLLRFKGLTNINDVEVYKGCKLKIKEDQLTDLAEHEFYYHEIIGCAVFTNDGEQIGTIKEILSPGANDVWVVRRSQGKDVLIPYIASVVTLVDTQASKVIIEPMEGLLD
ncbi:MAG: ribosome maturation factor RimM [Bacillota bacterium]|uniref:Ribosome maturation factor RimM n=1 Tax=Virgibacillus salarius TaxID=447199 RepID=A0A941DT34_9BACI|nr:MULTISPECIES: ribosome maturation factor RimM [Bacillaceae]NAZ07612.1 ribosome maturation factor RimM [Agaribacter marinus]MBR7794892.1 ribosome maturation factor RimM [Virgibacillus salarius]MCC2249305.1 ribosome maturation factor RimM [Virgibacillus sp. AGTR]MDY7043869.1 ribosome maturation factor RimM [Virgibacillus sp. M23]QRZ17338.1 ribosome maturation factor RimM [Virgibacillus sp. AGTR]